MKNKHRQADGAAPHGKKAVLKVLDYFFILLSIAVISFSFYFAQKNNGAHPMLVINSPSGEYVYSLSTNATYDIQGKIGVSKIVVDGGSAYFADSPCPNKTCVQCAPISRNGQWIACMPNQVFIRVENKGADDVDAVAF